MDLSLTQGCSVPYCSQKPPSNNLLFVNVNRGLEIFVTQSAVHPQGVRKYPNEERGATSGLGARN
jgi:hypothetical protein